MLIENFIKCLGKAIEVKRVNELEWDFKIREEIMLKGKVRVVISVIETVEIIFRNPDGYGKVELNQGKIHSIDYKGILQSKYKRRIEECAPILIEGLKTV
ncbi:hypothetical protein [Sulfuracidifex tepidarius]|uniref:Uncharacterized protein n=1 Tax=Sulfuracidifex tepidarius TaxID=1294262 RepID=A0A510E112_9CREN|nr:hypothetical protein [Sulfuracidifex tepidarius]BBG23424.1 hypothetical protein IC006_0708 [Sulfuracidifex tepidarius]BBG26176.1 hypothetical protein IC007_0681 [Sulfuracidifex tepidarius]